MKKINTEYKNIVMGVSLSNKTFNGKFCRELCDALIDLQPNNVFVFVGDRIEIVNYVIFGNKSASEARQTSLMRGHDLTRMFLKAFKPLEAANINYRVNLESELESSVEYGDSILGFEREIKRLMHLDPGFKRDVYSQVTHNLKSKKKGSDPDFLQENIEELSEYIVGELSVFFAIFEKMNQVTEIYPGENLFVKERFLAGLYDEFTKSSFKIDYEFIDVSNLSA